MPRWGNIPAGQPACRHCGRRRVGRPRGLCWRCFHTPGVAALYGPVSKYGRRGAGAGCGGYALPPAPTAALPGTAAKVAELERRAAARVSLWHPADAKADD